MTADSLIGRQLGNYRIERLLGRGGMASVYYATDVKLNRPAAVKVIDAHFRGRDSYASRFVQEARSVAAWRHENVVQIYYAGEEEGLLYFAMEYIDGSSLAKILTDQAAQGKLLPFADVLHYGRAIASALDYAHSKGVIHRDVKPQNVLVSDDGRVVLADFGLALDTAQGSMGEVFGTAHYTAPEQARRSNAAVPQSDLYSLGVILYEMLAGALPFDDPSPTSVALQHITLNPPPPRQVNPNISQEAEVVLLRALSKDPLNRYPSGAALMAELEAALQPQPVVLPTAEMDAPSLPSSVPPSSSSAREVATRYPVWLPALGLVMALCLVFSVFAGYAALRVRDGATPHGLASTTAPSDTPAHPQPSPTDLPLVKLPASTATLSPTAPTLTATPSVQTLPLTASPTVHPPTATAQPSITPANTPANSPPSPTPTLRYTDRRRFVLFYNEAGFYMLQTSGVGDLIGGVVFERLDADLQPAGSFNSTRWAKYSPSSLLNCCFRLEITGAENISSPSACNEKYLATLHLEPGDPAIFWTPEADSSFFRVLWREDELVRCEISAGTCEVYLP